MNPQIKELQNLRQQLIDTTSRFSEKKRLSLLFDKWSLKDVLAHLSGWDALTVELIEKFKIDEPPTWIDKINIFNQNSLDQRKSLTWEEIYKEFVSVSQKNIDQYLSIDNQLWNKKIWQNKSYTPSKFLKIDIDHYQEHLDEIKNHI